MIYVGMRRHVVESVAVRDDDHDALVDAINQLTNEIVLLAQQVIEKTERLRDRTERSDGEGSGVVVPLGDGHSEDPSPDRADGLDDDDGGEGR